jgi:hypothetical protein
MVLVLVLVGELMHLRRRGVLKRGRSCCIHSLLLLLGLLLLEVLKESARVGVLHEQRLHTHLFSRFLCAALGVLRLLLLLLLLLLRLLLIRSGLGLVGSGGVGGGSHVLTGGGSAVSLELLLLLSLLLLLLLLLEQKLVVLSLVLLLVLLVLLLVLLVLLLLLNHLRICAQLELDLLQNLCADGAGVH